MSRTVQVNPLLVLLAILVGTSIGDWLGGFFGAFVAALISIPVAGALQVIARELWVITASPPPGDGGAPAGGTTAGPASSGRAAARPGQGGPELSPGGDAELGEDPV
jgi:hypothetical protein